MVKTVVDGMSNQAGYRGRVVPHGQSRDRKARNISRCRRVGAFQGTHHQVTAAVWSEGAWLTANLSRAVQWLNVGYSIWFNPKYRRLGPLFQGRFKAILYDWASHGLTINKYIHLNPVRVRSLGGHEKRGTRKAYRPPILLRPRWKRCERTRGALTDTIAAKRKRPDG
jgi:hypothetical protein